MRSVFAFGWSLRSLTRQCNGDKILRKNLNYNRTVRDHPVRKQNYGIAVNIYLFAADGRIFRPFLLLWAYL